MDKARTLCSFLFSFLWQEYILNEKFSRERNADKSLYAPLKQSKINIAEGETRQNSILILIIVTPICY